MHLEPLHECPAKAKVLLEDMMLLGEDGYAQRNHCLPGIMQPPPGVRRRAMYSLLREDTPCCLPAVRIRQPPRGNPFDGLPDDL